LLGSALVAAWFVHPAKFMVAKDAHRASQFWGSQSPHIPSLKADLLAEGTKSDYMEPPMAGLPEDT